MNIVKHILFFLLGFAVAFWLLAFNSAVHVETNQKVIVSWDMLPEVFFANFEPTPQENSCFKINQI